MNKKKGLDHVQLVPQNHIKIESAEVASEIRIPTKIFDKKIEKLR